MYTRVCVCVGGGGGEQNLQHLTKPTCCSTLTSSFWLSSLEKNSSTACNNYKSIKTHLNIIHQTPKPHWLSTHIPPQPQTFIKLCKCEHYVSCMSKAVLHLSGFLCSHKVCRLPGVCNTETNKQSKNTIRAKHKKSQEQADSLFLANITFGQKKIREKCSWMDREDTH